MIDGLGPEDVDAQVYWQGGPPPFHHHALVSDDANRWNDAGVAAIYLAGDPGLTLVEAGRHLPALDAPEHRAIWRVRVRVPGIVDLRRADTRSRLGVDDDLWFLDRERCRAVVRSVRAVPTARGLRVPSAGLPDDGGRWNLVLYPDRIAVRLDAVIDDPTVVGWIGIGPTVPFVPGCPLSQPRDASLARKSGARRRSSGASGG
jgi:RES domain-containing protein